MAYNNDNLVTIGQVKKLAERAKNSSSGTTGSSGSDNCLAPYKLIIFTESEDSNVCYIRPNGFGIVDGMPSNNPHDLISKGMELYVYEGSYADGNEAIASKGLAACKCFHLALSHFTYENSIWYEFTNETTDVFTGEIGIQSYYVSENGEWQDGDYYQLLDKAEIENTFVTKETFNEFVNDADTSSSSHSNKVATVLKLIIFKDEPTVWHIESEEARTYVEGLPQDDILGVQLALRTAILYVVDGDKETGRREIEAYGLGACECYHLSCLQGVTYGDGYLWFQFEAFDEDKEAIQFYGICEDGTWEDWGYTELVDHNKFFETTPIFIFENDPKVYGFDPLNGSLVEGLPADINVRDAVLYVYPGSYVPGGSSPEDRVNSQFSLKKCERYHLATSSFGMNNKTWYEFNNLTDELVLNSYYVAEDGEWQNGGSRQLVSADSLSDNLNFSVDESVKSTLETMEADGTFAEMVRKAILQLGGSI